MKKPRKRPEIPPRDSDNVKRRLDPSPDRAMLDRLDSVAVYRGYAKHKAEPTAFGLEPYRKPRGDATLCDQHAGFRADQISAIPRILRRGISAGLIGNAYDQGVPRVIWAIGDDGWIFEARLTNADQVEYHGYPVRPMEAIAGPVYRRYAEWVVGNGTKKDRAAAEKCKAIYGFKS
jgi:hypothetical protein